MTFIIGESPMNSTNNDLSSIKIITSWLVYTNYFLNIPILRQYCILMGRKIYITFESSFWDGSFSSGYKSTNNKKISTVEKMGWFSYRKYFGRFARTSPRS